MDDSYIGGWIDRQTIEEARVFCDSVPPHIGVMRRKCSAIERFTEEKKAGIKMEFDRWSIGPGLHKILLTIGCLSQDRN